MTLKVSDYEAINRAIMQIYGLHDLDGYIETTMRLLPGMIDADVTAFNEVNYSARRMMTILDSPFAQVTYHERQPAFERLMHQNPLIEHHSHTRDAPKKITDFLSAKQWRETSLYQQYYRAIDGNFQIALVLTLKTETIVAFAFNRAQRDFTERHREVLTVLQPHLTKAYVNALRHTQSTQRLASREDMLEAIGAGWLDLDGNLHIGRSAPLVPETLSSFFPVQHVARDRLPPALEDWVTGQLRQGQAGLPPEPLVVEQDGRRLIVRLMGQSEAGGISLVVEHFHLSSSPQPLEALGLTQRQAEILYWVSQGKSNVEIAVMLKISARTVENHLYQILQILDVNNRTEAAQLAILNLATRS